MSIGFSGRVVLLGHGTIGRCALPMLLDALALEPRSFTVIEADDHGDCLASLRATGLDYRVRSIDRDNLAATLAGGSRPGDLLVNLSVGVESIDLCDWCHAHGVLYVDTALEPWEADNWNLGQPPHERTEYAFHQRARRQAERRWDARGATAVVTHGANPGLVSHFVKAALLDVARAAGADREVPADRLGWARLARDLGVRVIHISERDTQVAPTPRAPGEFHNTWSIPGFVEEATMPAEFGWGTHERALPPHAREHAEGPRNAIYVERPAGQVLLRSWVPLGGQIAGLALPHSESITLSDYLTLVEGGEVAYRPTVAFAYLACDAAMASLHEAMMRDWEMQRAQRILNDDIVAGRDELGVLLLGHALNGWWYGSQLDVHEARRLVPGNNPTAVQVAAGAVAAGVWATRNPDRGYCEPEHLPHEEILATARPWLGPMASGPTDWRPAHPERTLFEEPWLDPGDPWQFCNFLIR